MVSIDKFLEIEKKFNLYKDTIEGVNYWVYARVRIWDDIILKDCVNEGSVCNNVEKSSLKSKIQLYSKFISNSLKMKNIKSCDICIVNHPRRVYQKEYYECIYTDDIAQNLPENIVLEFPYPMNHLEPVKTNNLVYMDKVILKKIIGLILYKTIYKNRYKRMLDAVRERTETILEELEKAYSVKINREEIVDFIVQEIVYYKASIESIKKIIEKINPKVVVEVVSYNSNCMMINEVCKKMNIKTIELQHGILTDHLAYNFNSDVVIEQMPDKIMLFSDYWRQFINFPIKMENVITTGFPYFERKIKEAKKIEKYVDGRINILFISQGTIGKKLSEIAAQLVESVDKNSYRVFYKLHPAEFLGWEERYSCLKNENIIVLDNNKFDLYDYFATCQIQIGVYSTALYEGLGFGLATYIYRTELSEYMKMLCEKGYATYFRNCEELTGCIEKGQNDNFVLEFWQENALENMVNNIESLL